MPFSDCSSTTTTPSLYSSYLIGHQQNKYEDLEPNGIDRDNFFDATPIPPYQRSRSHSLTQSISGVGIGSVGAASGNMVKKRPSLQALQLHLPFKRRGSSSGSEFMQGMGIGYTLEKESPPWTSLSHSASSSEGDNGSGLLDDDPFAVDPARFCFLESSRGPLASGSSASGASTPSFTRSLRSSRSSQSSSSSSSHDVDEDNNDTHILEDESEQFMKVEPLHRNLPSPSISRTPSLRRRASRKPSLPCLAELEHRLVVAADMPRSAGVAKAKAKNLPFEPWDSLPSSTPPTSTTTTPTDPDAPQIIPEMTDLASFNSGGVVDISANSGHGSLPSVTSTTSPSFSSFMDFSNEDSQRTVRARGYTYSGGSPARNSGNDGDLLGYGNGNEWGSSAPKRSSHSNGGGEGGEEGDAQEGGGDSDHEGGRLPSSYFSSDSSSGSDEDESDSEDDYQGQDSPSALWHTPSPPRKKSDEEDDVPLAQRIPTALAAQKSIRREVKAGKKRSQSQQAQSKPRRRPGRTDGPSTSTATGVAADVLSKRLLEVQIASPTSPTKTNGHTPTVLSPSQQATVRAPRHSNRPAIPELPPLPPQSQSHERAGAELKRSTTSVAPRRSFTNLRASDPHPPHPQLENDRDRGVRRAKTSAGPRKPASASHTHSRHASRDDKIHPPPVPPVPRLSAAPPPSTKVQQRVFIRDSNTHTVVDLDETTSAADLIATLRSNPDLGVNDGGAIGKAFGEWMLWEVATDTGMERPIRSFELPLDIAASWNAEKRSNAFVLKKSPLASLLAKERIPGVAPFCSGWVQWESRQGRWNKRWMELREGSLFLAKKENSKEEVFLCSLSNFDTYIVSPRRRAPKGFTFALKSSDNAQLFENPADYSHTFSCDAKVGQMWLEKLLVARSFVLQQERTVLFRGQSAHTSQVSSSSAAVPSAGAQRRQPHAATLISTIDNNPKFTTYVAKSDFFEPGSLLARHIAT